MTVNTMATDSIIIRGNTLFSALVTKRGVKFRYSIENAKNNILCRDRYTSRILNTYKFHFNAINAWDFIYMVEWLGVK